MKAAGKIGHGLPAKVRTGLAVLPASWISILAVLSRRRGNLFLLLGQKALLRTLPGGPQHFGEGVARIFAAAGTPFPTPLQLAFRGFVTLVSPL